tara:strand:+ start:679 stop:2496 length:1818 start_codon:yes stop_codon:yes gene_type:complete
MQKITIFKNILNIHEPAFVTIESVLNAIQKGKYKDKIDAIRACKDKDQVRSLKSNLPCALFSGEFAKPITKKYEDGREYISYRDDKSLTSHSGFAPIDIDDIDDINTVREELINNPYIYALWLSSSGKGLHGLIRIGDGNKHVQHYKALLEKFKGLDPTARNPSRVLYLSYDPDIYINTSSSTFFDIIQDEDIKVSSIRIGDGYTDYKKMDVASRMIRLAPDGQKHHILLKAAHLLGGYIATKHIEYDMAFDILVHEISKKNVDSMSIAKDTINDGLRHGMTKPISEIEMDYREAVRDIGVMEEDLSFLSSNSKDDDFIYRFRAGLIPLGLPFGYYNLDQHLRLKEGEFYAALAHTSVGKTTVNLWLIFLSSVHYNWNWMMYMGENSSASVKMKMMEFFIGKRIQQMSDLEHNVSLKFIEEHFSIMSTDCMYTYGDILDHSKTLMQYKSLKGIFIDPYNSLKMELTNSKNKYIYDYEAYTNMLNYTRKYNTTIFLSVHTTTEAQRDRDRDGNQRMPHASQAEGGSVLSNKVDTFMTYHRKIKDPVEWMWTEVSIDKVRSRETGGKPTVNGSPCRLRMNNGIEFVDENGLLPFNREQLLFKHKCRF